MPAVNEITLKANIKDVEKTFKKLPGVMGKEAQAMALEFGKGLEKMDKKAKKISRDISADLKKIGKASLAVASAIAAGGAAFALMSRKVADATNELVDASTKTNITIDNLKALRLAAQGSGLEFSALEAGLLTLPERMIQVQEGSLGMVNAFKALGVEVEDSKGNLRDTNAVFEDVLAGLGALDNASQRAAISMRIFGGSGAALLQSGIIGGLEAMTALTKEFGLDTGPQAVAEAAEFQRQLALLGEVATRTGQEILKAFKDITGIGLSDVMQSGIESLVYFTEFIKSSATILDGFFLDLFQKMEAVFDGFVKIVSFDWSNLGSQDAHIFEVWDSFAPRAGQAIEEAMAKADEAVRRMQKLNREASQSASNDRKQAGKEIDSLNSKEEEALKQRLNTLEEIQAANEKLWDITLQGAEGEISKIQQIEIAHQKRMDQITRIHDQAKKNFVETKQQGESEEDFLRRKDAMDQANHLAKMARMEAERLFNLEIQEEQSRLLDDQQQKMLGMAEEQASMFASTAESVAGSMGTIMENQIEAIQIQEEEAMAKIQALQDKGVISKAQAEQQKNQIQKRFSKQAAEEEERLFKFKKMTSIASAIINALLASSRAFADHPFPQSAIISGLAGAAAFAEVAAIQSQPPPKFDIGGMIGQSSGLGPDQIKGQLLTGEAILDRATVRRIGGEEGVSSLLRGGVPNNNFVVVSPWKHFDKFLSSGMSRSGTIRRQLQPKRIMEY